MRIFHYVIFVGIFMICIMFFGAEKNYFDISNLNEKDNPHIQVKVSTDKFIFEEGDEIFVQVLFQNESKKESDPLLIGKKTLVYNFDIELYGERTSHQISEKEEYFEHRDQLLTLLKGITPETQQQFFNSVILESEEVRGFKTTFSDKFDLSPGTYYFRFIFYPYGVLNKEFKVYSNKVKIKIKSSEGEKNLNLYYDKTFDLIKEIKTPEDTILKYFETRKSTDWNSCFLLIDFHSLIKRFPPFYESYEINEGKDQIEILNHFKFFLQDLFSNERILSYEILKQEIHKDEALINVEVSVSNHQRNLRREYIFKLKKKNYWLIVDYSVMPRQ